VFFVKYKDCSRFTLVKCAGKTLLESYASGCFRPSSAYISKSTTNTPTHKMHSIRATNGEAMLPMPNYGHDAPGGSLWTWNELGT